MQVAGRDDYDDADGGANCRAMMASMPDSVAAHKDEAYDTDPAPRRHIYGTPRSRSQSIPSMTATATKGRGGEVRIVTDAQLAARTRATTVKFFKDAFGM